MCPSPPPTLRPPSASPPSARGSWLVAAALAYLAFVIYGSLVPWSFRPMPLAEAWQRFQAIPYLQLGLASRADWVANLLLFIPLAFLWLGALWPRQGLARRGVLTGLVVAAGVALSLAVEFAQIFFPPRTVSRNDILAESLGATAGAALWWWRGPALTAWVDGWHRRRGPAEIAEHVLWPYLALLFGYNLLPLDLTISPVELYHKWQEGKIVLVPFTRLPDGFAAGVYELATDTALWIPVGFLWLASGRRTAPQAWAWTVAAACVLEGLQLLVYSRVTDVTDLLTATLGGLLGVVAARAYRPRAEGQPKRGRLSTPALGAALFLAGALMAAAVFWYPFDFTADPALLRERLTGLTGTPLASYYYGTEFRAVTSLLHQTLFFAPLGIGLALLRDAVRQPDLRAPYDALAVLTLALAAGVVELGQVALPAKHPAGTDWLLGTLGGALGYISAIFLRLRAAIAPSRQPGAALRGDTGPGPQPCTAPPRPGAVQGYAAHARAHGPRPATLPAGVPSLRASAWPAWLVAGATVVLLLLPARPDTPLAGLGAALATSGLADGLAGAPQRVYALWKAVMLWIPLGLLLAFAGWQTTAHRWAPAAAVALAAFAVAHPDDLTLAGLLEVLAAPLGLWAGLWVGARSLAPASTGQAASAGIPPNVLAARATRPSPSLAAGLLGSTSAATRGRWLGRVAATAVLGVVLAHALGFPRWPLWLAGGLAVYAVLLWRYPLAWLVAVPAALPVLDLAPWTGRFFVDELDLLLAVTAAAALWHGPHPGGGLRWSRTFTVLLGLLGLCVLIAALRGLLPLEPLDENALASYWSAWNAARVARGFLWALVVWALLRFAVPGDPAVAVRLFAAGTGLGLLTLVLASLRERWQFGGLFDLEVPYRITGTLSSMHTGGGHLEAYLVAAIPFLWLWLVRGRAWPAAVAGGLALALAAWVTAATVSRAGVAALALTLLLLGTAAVLAGLRARGPVRVGALAAVLPVAAAAAVLLLALGGTYFQSRLATVGEDLATRREHWRAAVHLVPPDPGSALFGIGLGRFPEAYLHASPSGRVPGTYRYLREGGNVFLRMAAGETLYVVQRVPVEPARTYRVALRLRAEGARARVDVPLCEKHLLESRACRWEGVSAPGDGAWHEVDTRIDSLLLGAGGWLSRAPVDLQLWVPPDGPRVDVDDVRLIDPEGRDLVRNGDFQAGADYWFFRTDSHLPWHVKNLWVALRVEAGWAGVAAFTALAAVALGGLAARVGRGDVTAGVFLAAVAGFLANGLFDSPFDAPRLTLLFFTILALGTALRADPVQAAGRG